MKNIANRIASLEKKKPRNDIFVVMAERGEDKEDSIKKAMNAAGLKTLEGKYVAYINLYNEKN